MRSRSMSREHLRSDTSCFLGIILSETGIDPPIGVQDILFGIMP
jgi:hypothetical protein